MQPKYLKYMHLARCGSISLNPQHQTDQKRRLLNLRPPWLATGRLWKTINRETLENNNNKRLCECWAEIHITTLSQRQILSKGKMTICVIDFQTVSLYSTHTGLQLKTILDCFIHLQITNMAEHAQPKTPYLLKKVRKNKTHNTYKTFVPINKTIFPVDFNTLHGFFEQIVCKFHRYGFRSLSVYSLIELTLK